jgi:hypothetical protein
MDKNVVLFLAFLAREEFSPFFVLEWSNNFITQMDS